MATWTYEALEEAISNAKPVDEVKGDERRSLYQVASGTRIKGKSAEIDEASFVDAVSRNLRRGRFLLLIVGDGIREGIESMTEFLQQHSGLHFALAIVELALFEVPNGGYVVQPRVLARTVNIDRGIVTIDDGRIAIRAPINASTTAVAATRMTITRELFFEELEKHFQGISKKMDSFIGKLEGIHVSTEFGVDSMILRWRPDDTRSWNLGTILSSGKVVTDYLSAKANAESLGHLSENYLTTLAGLIGGASVKQTPKPSGWYVSKDGTYVKIDALLEHEDGWLHAIEELQTAVVAALHAGQPNGIIARRLDTNFLHALVYQSNVSGTEKSPPS